MSNLQQVCQGLHQCDESCAKPCLCMRQVVSVAGVAFEVCTDVLTDQVHYELISDEDCERLYINVLLKTWTVNNIAAFPYEPVHTQRHVQIMQSLYSIAREVFEAEPLFLGWVETSRFYQSSP